MNIITKTIKRILFGKSYEGNLKVGDKIYSPTMKKDLIITRILSDDNWYFVIEHPNYQMLRDFADEGVGVKAKIKLSELEKSNLLDKVSYKDNNENI